MKKRTDNAFGKEVYLLGEDKGGILYWLEAPSWDCEWYWGFGYIETYTNNKHPSKSRDINSHQHITNPLEWFINEDKILNNTPFTDKEKWELCELFKRFYLFKDMVGFYHSGGSNICEVKLNYTKDEGKENEFNKVVIPEIMERIINILKGE